MKTIDHRGFTVCVFHGKDQDEVEEVVALQNNLGMAGGTVEKLIFVPMEGCDSEELRQDRFLISNPESSLVNHFMWEEIWSQKEQDQKVLTMVDKFIDTKKQAVIENYEYVPDEPFYDYSGGR